MNAPAPDISVLREMVRLAENRRTEALESIERMNKYNLALIGFAGSFLSLLLTVDIHENVLRISGISLIITIVVSLYAIRPQKILGGAPDIEEDISLIKQNIHLSIDTYLLEVSAVTNNAATALQTSASVKKRITIISAVFLAFSLIITYILVGYAKAF